MHVSGRAGGSEHTSGKVAATSGSPHMAVTTSHSGMYISAQQQDAAGSRHSFSRHRGIWAIALRCRSHTAALTVALAGDDQQRVGAHLPVGPRAALVATGHAVRAAHLLRGTQGRKQATVSLQKSAGWLSMKKFPTKHTRAACTCANSKHAPARLPTPSCPPQW